MGILFKQTIRETFQFDDVAQRPKDACLISKFCDLINSFKWVQSKTSCSKSPEKGKHVDNGSIVLGKIKSARVEPEVKDRVDTQVDKRMIKLIWDLLMGET